MNPSTATIQNSEVYSPPQGALECGAAAALGSQYPKWRYALNLTGIPVCVDKPK